MISRRPIRQNVHTVFQVEKAVKKRHTDLTLIAQSYVQAFVEMFIFVDAIKDMTKTACCQTLHVYLHVWNKRSCCAPQQDVRYYCSSLNMHIMLSFNVEHILNTLTMLNAGAWITCNLCSSDAESYMCAIIIKITKKKQSVDHLCWSSAAHKVRFLCMWSGHASQITPVCLLFISFTSVSLAKEFWCQREYLIR